MGPRGAAGVVSAGVHLADSIDVGASRMEYTNSEQGRQEALCQGRHRPRRTCPLRLEIQTIPTLPGGISAEFVSFSKDGRYVANVSYPDGILWKANRDGRAPVQLTEPPLYPKLISWSPDGSQILFAAESPKDSSRKIYVVSSQPGTSPRRLLPEDNGTESDPSWSPDGRRIAYSTGETNDASSVVSVLELSNNKVSILPGSVGMIGPHWSPDGRSVVAISFDMITMKLFDFETQRWSIRHKGLVIFPTWSTDSQFIYFWGGETGATTYATIFRIGVSGGEPERVVDLKDLTMTGLFGGWTGIDPTGVPIVLRDVGSNDIFALTLEEK